MRVAQVWLDLGQWHRPQLRRSEEELNGHVRDSPALEATDDCISRRRSDLAQRPRRFAPRFPVPIENRAQIGDRQRIAKKADRVGGVGGNLRVRIPKQRAKARRPWHTDVGAHLSDRERGGGAQWRPFSSQGLLD
jgi:hypothetical protein